jgi:hypothetical protein
MDGDLEREVDPAAVGELVITEVMSEPVSGQLEWFEVEVTGEGSVDLRGLTLRAPSGSTAIPGNDCRAKAEGERFIFVREGAPAQPEGLPSAEATFTFLLANDNGTVSLTLGDVTIDAATWGAGGAGVAFNLDPDEIADDANDLAADWCSARLGYGTAGSLGTPAKENSDCLQAGECFDASGAAREIDPPEDHEVVINEFLANPSGDDEGFEWVEIYAAAAFDLNGLVLRRVSTTTATHTFTSEQCLAVAPTELDPYFVLASGAVANADFQYPSSFTLANSTGTVLAIDRPDATVVDSITYLTPTSGRSRALRLTHRSDDLNDDGSATAWCTPTAPLYDGTNAGTPGSENICP